MNKTSALRLCISKELRSVSQVMATAMAKPEHNDWSRPEYKRSDFGAFVRGKYVSAIQESKEREKVEAEYHRMKPEAFDKLMSRAKPANARAGNRSAAQSRSKRKSKATEKKRAA